VMARRMLAKAARELEASVEPPALDAASQRVRAASVLLERSVHATEWSNEHLVDGLNQPVYTV
ncbi:MAG: aromatic ring-hydroxylating dioxygenase subunit alpha, partial [Gammaproteobacteria bacterium]